MDPVSDGIDESNCGPDEEEVEQPVVERDPGPDREGALAEIVELDAVVATVGREESLPLIRGPQETDVRLEVGREVIAREELVTGADLHVVLERLEAQRS